jgi:DNA-binding MarR family transcriptional regulator
MINKIKVRDLKILCQAIEKTGNYDFLSQNKLLSDSKFKILFPALAATFQSIELCKLLEKKGASQLANLMEILLSSSEINRLFYNPSKLEKTLTCRKQQLDKATSKIGELQKKILLKVYEKRRENEPLEWIPKELLGIQTEAEQAACSKALSHLEKRGLLIRQQNQTNSLSAKTNSIRTAYVQLTELGETAARLLRKKAKVANRLGKNKPSG